MELKITADERRDFRFSRSGKNQKAATSNILEAIAQISGAEAAATEDGRMRIVVKKEDVKQVLEAIRDGRGWGRRAPAASPPCAALEQRLNLMRRRQLLRAASQVKARSRGSWRPALQSIPEEI